MVANILLFIVNQRGPVFIGFCNVLPVIIEPWGGQTFPVTYQIVNILDIVGQEADTNLPCVVGTLWAQLHRLEIVSRRAACWGTGPGGPDQQGRGGDRDCFRVCQCLFANDTQTCSSWRGQLAPLGQLTGSEVTASPTPSLGARSAGSSRCWEQSGEQGWRGHPSLGPQCSQWLTTSIFLKK